MKIHKSHFILLLLFLVFFLPMLLAWLQYSYHHVFNKSLTNHGTLINPPFPMANLALHPTPVSGKWLMLLFYNTACTTVCQQDLYHLRQIRTALGADMDRVQRVLVSTVSLTNDHELNALLSSTYNGTLHVTTTQQTLTPSNGTIYLADPHGNVMMKYAPNAGSQGIYKDLKKLLRISQIG